MHENNGYEYTIEEIEADIKQAQTIVNQLADTFGVEFYEGPILPVMNNGNVSKVVLNDKHTTYEVYKLVYNEYVNKVSRLCQLRKILSNTPTYTNG